MTPQDDDSEEGDGLCFTNAVMKMKERQYKRKSIFERFGQMQTLDEPSQSTIKLACAPLQTKKKKTTQ